MKQQIVIVRLKGGLGNQMFQYAFGKKISLKRKANLKFDKTFLEHPNWQKITGVAVRDYELGEFNLKVQFSSFWENITSILSKKCCYLDSYWQGEKYFKDVKNLIYKDFRLKDKSKNFIKASKLISGTNSVSIHFRRGDYAEKIKTKKYHGLVGLDYFVKAINIINGKIANPHFYIFSDDPNWVKKNLNIGKPVTYISGSFKLTNAEELVLMSNCKNNIISNSSFSWWGAWLNKNPRKIVVAPKKWFRANVNDNDIVPHKWIRV